MSTPVTSLQRAMLLASLSGGTPRYLIQIALELDRPLDLAVLRAAWTHTLAAHPQLSARFRFAGAELVQDVLDPAPPVIHHDRLGAGSTGRDALLDADRAMPFDVCGDGPLWRMRVIDTDGCPSVWALTIHHALIDAHSYSALVPQLFRDYESLERGQSLPAGSPACGFPEFLRWYAQRDWAPSEAFWRACFAPGPTAGLVDVHGSAPAEDGALRDRVAVPITQELDQRLRDTASAAGVSMNVLVLAAWALWCARSADEPHVVFGVLRAGRTVPVAGIDAMIGPCLDTLPLTLAVPESGTIGDWLASVRDAWRALREVEHCPLERVHAWAGLAPSAPLFRTVVNFQREGLGEVLAACGHPAGVRLLGVRQTSDLPLVVAAFERPTLSIELVRDPDEVPLAHMEEAARALCAVLPQLAGDPGRPLRALTLLTPEGEERARVDACGPLVERDPAALAPRLFEEIAMRQPDAPALVAPDRTWTYREVERTTRHIAAHLRAAGAGPGQVIGAVLPASPALALLVLGIARTGAAFCVVNAELPEVRQRALFDAAGVAFAVRERHDAGAPGVDALMVPRDTSAIGVDPRPSDLAYLVHTSGSTGDPRFVAIEHAALAGYLPSMAELCGVTPADRRLQRAPPGTDFFISELLVNLCAGAALVFTGAGPLGIVEFLELLDRQRISVTGIPSSYWHEWVRAMRGPAPPALPRHLRLVVTGMEQVDLDALRTWERLVGDRIRWINVYGPSETTSVATAYAWTAPLRDHLREVPIGRPLPNTQVLVLDRERRIRPRGLAGEIWISGTGVMRGYVGESDGDRVQPNPHAPSALFRRSYRTGDIGYVLPDGNLAFRGRRDNQVKIRGHRVELEAVESALSRAVPGARAVAFLNDRTVPPSLWACVDVEAAVDADAVRAALARELPAAMVPARVLRAKLPVLPNGKVDRQRVRTELPADEAPRERVTPPQAGSLGMSSPTPGPEELITSVFRQILERPDLQAESDVFRMGADSLALVRACASIEQLLGWHPPLRDVYEGRTARALALRHAAGSQRGVVVCEPADANDVLDARLHVLAIPPATGLEPRFAHVARFWRSPAKLWCLQQEPPALDPELHSIRSLARTYARDIAARFAGQNVALWGYSSGGLMAWEIAALLRDSSVLVTDVVLLEPPTDRTTAADPADWAPTPPFLQLMRLHWHHSRTLDPSEQVAYMARLVWRKASRVVRGADDREIALPLPPSHEAYNNAVARAYIPPPQRLRVRLMRSVDRIRQGDIAEYDRYWSERALELHRYALLGNHARLLADPEVRLTVRETERALAGALQPRT